MTNQKGSRTEGPARGHSERVEKKLGAAAKRALAEAEQRRAKRLAEEAEGVPKAKEIDGVDGPEPVRYGDWENKGRTSDF